MAILDDLINQITDEALKERIQKELAKQNKKKKFGLVFEEHLPENTPLYDLPIKIGSAVAIKGKGIKKTYIVTKTLGNMAFCFEKGKPELLEEIPLDDLVCVAEFGEAIYPYLKPIDSVCNAPDDEIWHTLIEADNYHALQLLEYLYAGKVDCIYIDPPYNTGAKDWKYNNDYVDSNDAYRHSKWLSMMQKRLLIAKQLLNPNDSVMIITIDEKEYLHLGCLLEEMFPEAKIQMISSVINHGTIARDNEFNRNNEYIFFVMFGHYSIAALDESKNFGAGDEVNWRTLRRTNAKNVRATLPNQFYPIYVDNKEKKIVKIGDPVPIGSNVKDAPQIPGCTAVFPIRDDGTEMVWGCRPEECRIRWAGGYVKVGGFFPDKPQQYSLTYLTTGTIADIEAGKISITGHYPDGSVIASYNTHRAVMPKTQWDIPSHDARDYGTYILKTIFPVSPFSFPKSLYAVHDALKYFVANKPNALIVDFFAGSGTTLHAVNLLNAEDGGHRQCILVTNNEVSEAENKELSEKGYRPGDDEWEKLGIAHCVTWPRTVCSIKGLDISGNPLKGDYLAVNLPMSAGFKTNANFFKLGFLDKNAVSLGRQFKELLPVLWMKAGAKGECPSFNGDLPKMMVFEKNHFAVLFKENCFSSFEKELKKHRDISTVYFITDSEDSFTSMANRLPGKTSYQLYRDYLDNFRINTGRK